MTELVQKLIDKEKENRTGCLDLGRCGLTELPDLSKLYWLETLIISNKWWDNRKDKMENSKNQWKPNSLSYISVDYLPPFLKYLSLGGLYEENNKFEDFIFLEKLTNLQVLDLSCNNVSDCSFLGELTNLQTLYLYKNNINDCNFLKKLTNLQTLNLSENNINNWGFLEKLTNLQNLDLNFTNINDGRVLEKLTNLHILRHCCPV